jgi:hypothetical protein
MSAIQTANSCRQASTSPEPQLIQSVYRTPHLSGRGPETQQSGISGRGTDRASSEARTNAEDKLYNIDH